MSKSAPPRAASERSEASKKKRPISNRTLDPPSPASPASTGSTPSTPPDKPRWPGACPVCSRPLEVYSKNTDWKRHTRRKYLRCQNPTCYYRTTSVETLEPPPRQGPSPASTASMETPPSPKAPTQ